MDIRDPLRQAFIEPKLPIGVPNLYVTSWSRSIGVKLPDHLDVFCFTDSLWFRIL